MSYDVWIGDFEANLTSNVSPVFYDHFPNGEGINGLHGMTGRQVQEECRGFWESFERKRMKLWEHGAVGEPKLRANYDAPNGWGSLESALSFVGRIQSACEKFPRYKFKVWS